MKVVYTDGFMKDLKRLTSLRHRILSIPGDFYRSIKWSIQRHIRGYADCDLWDMHDALGKIIIKHLKAFKKSPRSGYQMMSDETKDNKDGCTVPANPDPNIKAWEDCIDDMIEGFEFLSNDQDKLMEFCDKYKDEMVGDKHKSHIEYDKAYEEAKKKAYKFIDYFGALWD